MNCSKMLLGLAGCTLVAALSGCVVEASPAPPPPTVGSITLAYSIQGSSGSAACVAASADQIQVIIRDGAGIFTSATGPCEYSSLTIGGLPGGRYEVDATLLDVNARPASDTLVFHDADVIEGSNLVISADFPGAVLR